MDSELKRLKDEEFDYFQKLRKKNDVFEFDYHLLDVKPKASASNPKPVTSQSTVQNDKAKLQADIKADIKKEVNSQFTGMDDEKQTGSTSPRKANFWDWTVGSFGRSYNTTAQGKEYYNAMFGKENRVDEYNEKLSSDQYNFEVEGWLGKTISGVSGLLGQMAYQLTTPETATLTAGMAGLAAVAGQAGPQALAPEEIVTVPWMASKGFQIGNAVSNFKIATGHAYHELLEHDVSQETAQKIALTVGTVSGLIENSQMDELFKSFQFIDKTNADDAAWKLLGKWWNEYILSTTGNALEETAQEAVTIGGVNLGSLQENGTFAITPEESQQRMGGTFVDSLYTYGGINAVKSAAAVHSASRNTNADPVSTQQTDSTTYAQDDFSTNAIEEDSRSWAQFASNPLSEVSYDMPLAEVDDSSGGWYSPQSSWNATNTTYGFDINAIVDDAAQRAQFDWDETTTGIYQSQPNWGMRDAYDMNAIVDDVTQRAQFDWDETSAGIYQSQPNWGMRDAYDVNAIMDDATQRAQFDWDETSAGIYQSQPNWGMRDAYDVNAIVDDVTRRAQFDGDKTTAGTYQSQASQGLLSDWELDIIDRATTETIQEMQSDGNGTTTGTYRSQASQGSLSDWELDIIDRATTETIQEMQSGRNGSTSGTYRSQASQGSLSDWEFDIIDRATTETIREMQSGGNTTTSEIYFPQPNWGMQDRLNSYALSPMRNLYGSGFTLDANMFIRNSIWRSRGVKRNKYPHLFSLIEHKYPNLVAESEIRDPARFRDSVLIIPPLKGDAITHRRLHNSLAKSALGLETIEYITSGECSVEINYTDEAPEGERAYTTGRSIVVFAKNTKTINETARTLVHEVTHAKYGIGGSQYAEVICFAREHIHTYGKLTFTDLKDIIKLVKELYPEYEWRKGGRNQWRKN